jgi:Transposase DDE domain group 1
MMKNKKKISNSIEIKTSFNGGALTNYSGIKPIQKFMEKLGVAKSLNTLGIKLHHNAKHDTGTILSILILGIISGMNRISKIENFTHDPLLQKIFGLSGKISDSAIIDRLKRFGMKQSSEFMGIIGEISNTVHKKLGNSYDILDLDSSVKTVYGNQEGAEKGFNEKKRGAKSYHPLMAFLNSTRECLLSWLRPGNTYTANGADEFIKQTFAMLPKSLKSLLVRADSGFFSDKLISVIEKRKGARYLIKAKLKNMASVMYGQDWQDVPLEPCLQICDFEYRPASWAKARHFSAVRILKEEEKEGELFPAKKWEYFCYCTDIDDSPLQIHKLYGDRGTSENWIENVKNQMFAGQLLTNDFWANEMLWLSSVMAYNISVWMRKLCDEKSWHEEPATFRAWFVQLAGKVVKSGRQVFLKMYKAYYYKERWRKIDDAVDNLSFA